MPLHHWISFFLYSILSSLCVYPTVETNGSIVTALHNHQCPRPNPQYSWVTSSPHHRCPTPSLSPQPDILGSVCHCLEFVINWYCLPPWFNSLNTQGNTQVIRSTRYRHCRNYLNKVIEKDSQPLTFGDQHKVNSLYSSCNFSEIAPKFRIFFENSMLLDNV